MDNFAEWFLSITLAAEMLRLPTFRNPIATTFERPSSWKYGSLFSFLG